MTKKQRVTYQHQLTVTTPICFPGSDTEFPPCSGFRIRHYSVETSRGQHSATQTCSAQFSSVAQSCPDSLRPHESQHTRPPCPSPTPGGAGSSQFLVIQAQGMLTQQGLSAEPALCTRHSWKPLPHEEMEAPTAPFILKLQDWDQVPSFHEWDRGPWNLPLPGSLMEQVIEISCLSPASQPSRGFIQIQLLFKTPMSVSPVQGISHPWSNLTAIITNDLP